MLRTLLLSVGLALTAAAPSGAQDLRIALNDLLRLRVVEWDPLGGEVRDWPALSAEYRVGPDGTIVLPFAGRIRAEGRLPGELEDEIGLALRERLAMAEPPEVTVEFAGWPPVIVTGDVRTPGPYEFTPGMVAIQAAGLAGGVGAPVGDYMSHRRETVTRWTDVVVLRNEEQRLVARRARLVAELDSRDTVEMTGGEGPEWDRIVQSEQRILRIRHDRLARELSAIDSEVQLFAAEISALEQKTAALERQRELANQQAANADDLAERGLVGNQRVLDTARTLADIENQLLDVSTAILAARQNLAAAERERIGLQDARTAEIVESLQEADSELADARERIAGQLVLVQDLGAGVSELEPRMTVLRPQDGEMLRIPDAEMVPLRPGDIVEVIQPLPLDTSLPGEVGAADPASLEPIPSLAAPVGAKLPPLPEPAPPVAVAGPDEGPDDGPTPPATVNVPVMERPSVRPPRRPG